MQIRALKGFSYVAGKQEVRVPRGLSVDLPDEVAKAAVAVGQAVALQGVARAAPSSAIDDLADLDGMSHAALLALAEQHGVEVKKSNSKAEIVAAIKGGR